MKLFDPIIEGLHKNMDLTSLRQTMINANIANVDTPGYKPVDLDFKTQLAQYLESQMNGEATSEQGMDIEDVTGFVVEQAGTHGVDENAVDLDRQMAHLAGNAMDFNASAKMMRKKLGMLKYIINESR